MKVLSLCDGLGIGYHALIKAGVAVDEYCSIEIDRSARELADANSDIPFNRPFNDLYKMHESLTDLRGVNFDLVLLGFTCSSLTVQGNREGLKGESGILLPALDIIDAVFNANPEAKFLIENVASMSNSNRDEIDDLIESRLGVRSTMISSALLSGQDRRRLYWTNVPFEEIEDRGISALSVLEEDALGFRAWSKSTRYVDKDGKKYSGPGPDRTSYTENRYRTDDKANTLVTGKGCKGPSTRNEVITENGVRSLTVRECARLQTLPDSFNFNLVSNPKAYKSIGLGWTLDIIAHILGGLVSHVPRRD